MVYVAPSIWKVALLHFLKIFPLTNCRVALPWVAGFELISRRTVALVSNRFLNSSNDRSLDRSGVLSLSLRTCPHTCPVGMFDSADFLSIVFSFFHSLFYQIVIVIDEHYVLITANIRILATVRSLFSFKKKQCYGGTVWQID